jgi:hypothetical protein
VLSSTTVPHAIDTRGWKKVTYGSPNVSSSPGKVAPQFGGPTWGCALYVGPTTLNSSNQLTAETLQTCTGDYGEQAVLVYFLRSAWDYPHNYGGASSTDFTTSSWLDTTWLLSCGGGGTYDYWLAAVGTVDSPSGGGQSPEDEGSSTRKPCGTHP